MQYYVHEIKVGSRTATLKCYIPEGAPHAKYRDAHPGIIVIPGGGYRNVVAHEGEPIALQYLSYGFSAFVLDYTVFPEGVFPQALLELLQAVRYVRENAEAFSVDPHNIAVCGFSAGGHLAASAATLWKHPALTGMIDDDRRLYRPDKAILVYPVTSYESHHGSYHNLAGGKELLTPELLETVSVEKHIDADTPPAYIWHNFNDPTVKMGESLLFAKRMYDCGVPVEVRIYPTGGHGNSLGNFVTQNLEYGSDEPCSGWVADTIPFCFRQY